MSDVRVPDLNRVFIAGRLTRDPELKYLPSNTPYCRLGVANVRYYKDKNGERREETTFVDVTVWGPQAEYIGERLRKGRPVLVEGSLRMNEWEDQATGQKRTRITINAQRVTPLDWDDSGSSSRPAPQSDPHGGGAAPEPREIEEPITDDDIPF